MKVDGPGLIVTHIGTSSPTPPLPHPFLFPLFSVLTFLCSRVLTLPPQVLHDRPSWSTVSRFLRPFSGSSQVPSGPVKSVHKCRTILTSQNSGLRFWFWPWVLQMKTFLRVFLQVWRDKRYFNKCLNMFPAAISPLTKNALPFFLFFLCVS